MLYRYRNNKFEQEWDLSPYLGRPYGKAYITFCDSHDRVWIGIDDVGVVMFDPSEQKFQKIRLADDFLDVHAFMEDRDGNIWIGTERGIYLFDGKEALQQEWMSQNYRNNVIFALKQDKLDRIWVGTYGSGIMIYDMECNKCDSINSHSGLCNDNITQIYEDADYYSRRISLYQRPGSSPRHTKLWESRRHLGRSHQSCLSRPVGTNLG